MGDCVNTPEPEVITLGGRPCVVRATDSADAPAVLELFAHVFGERQSPDWFAWKYGAAGLDGRACGLWDEDGRLIAHYAGFPRTLLWQGKPRAALQIGDLMVAPEARGLFTRKGAFFHLASLVTAHWAGPGRPFALAFGFPQERALRLGERLGFYRGLGVIEMLRWPAQIMRPALLWRCEAVAAEGLAEVADACWQTMRRENDALILGQRDADYLRRRYRLRPDAHYEYALLRPRAFGSPALAVWRRAGDMLRWVDFVGPRRALPHAIRTLQALAAQAGAAGVECWACPALAERLAPGGARRVGAACQLTWASAAVGPVDAALFHAGWWMGGDTDFL